MGLFGLALLGDGLECGGLRVLGFFGRLLDSRGGAHFLDLEVLLGEGLLARGGEEVDFELIPHLLHIASASN